MIPVMQLNWSVKKCHEWCGWEVLSYESCSSPSLARVKQLHINVCTPHMLTRSRLVLKCGKTHWRVSGPALGRTVEPSRSQLAQLPSPSSFQPSHHSSPLAPGLKPPHLAGLAHRGCDFGGWLSQHLRRGRMGAMLPKNTPVNVSHSRLSVQHVASARCATAPGLLPSCLGCLWVGTYKTGPLSITGTVKLTNVLRENSRTMQVCFII